jgi:hypothetical protein
VPINHDKEHRTDVFEDGACGLPHGRGWVCEIALQGEVVEGPFGQQKARLEVLHV